MNPLCLSSLFLFFPTSFTCPTPFIVFYVLFSNVERHFSDRQNKISLNNNKIKYTNEEKYMRELQRVHETSPNTATGKNVVTIMHVKEVYVKEKKHDTMHDIKST